MTYPVFLAMSAVLLWTLERRFPRRPDQRWWRRGLVVDLLLLAVNTEAGGLFAAWVLAKLMPAAWFEPWRAVTGDWVRQYPVWLEMLMLWVAKDFVQYLVHNLLHRVPWLWKIHKLHHSTVEMDWLSNWRFHPLEIAIYQTALYLPAILLGFRTEALVWCAFLSTFISELAHANVRFRFGPLRYLFNTPEFHLWHHVHPDEGPVNRNFGVSFSVWDWLFGTAHCPEGGRLAPRRLGI